MRLPWRKKQPELVEEVKRLRLDPQDVLVVVGARILYDDEHRPVNPFDGVIANRVVMFEEPDAEFVVLARTGSTLALELVERQLEVFQRS